MFLEILRLDFLKMGLPLLSCYRTSTFMHDPSFLYAGFGAFFFLTVGGRISQPLLYNRLIIYGYKKQRVKYTNKSMEDFIFLILAVSKIKICL